MTIKDAAKELNVEAHVLRYWEDELGLNISRNDLGHRDYQTRDILMFERILLLKKKGYSLKDIRDAINTYKECNNEQSEIKKEDEDKDENKDKEVADSSNELTNQESNVVDFKMAQLQSLMNKLVANALRENKGIIGTSLKAEITEDVMKQMDVIIKEKEEREEERFRKLDETLRRLQQVNSEVAATRVKRGLFGKR